MTWFRDVHWTELAVVIGSTLVLKGIPGNLKKARESIENGMYVKYIIQEYRYRAVLALFWSASLVHTVFWANDMAWAPWFSANLVDDAARFWVHWKGCRLAVAREVIEG